MADRDRLDTTISSRQREILELLEAGGPQQIGDLADRFGLTTQTIRRDINALCELGRARRRHGGVDLPVVTRNLSINARALLNGGAKRRIATRLAREIPAGSTVFLGIGTTVKFVAEALRDHAGLTIVTNNLDVAQTLGVAPNVELHVTGGIWRPDDHDLVGPDAVKFFEKFYATYAVVGAGALSPQSGVLDFSYGEAQISNAIIENSRTRFLVADSSKWTRDAPVRVAPLSKMTQLVTDRLPDSAEIRRALAASGIGLIVCEDTSGSEPD